MIFTKEWDLLHEKCGVSNTLKVHIMKHHIKDYLYMTGMPLGRRTDQTTEAAHQLMNKRLERSNYKVKNVESESHGRKLFKCVLHLNAYNI